MIYISIIIIVLTIAILKDTRIEHYKRDYCGNFYRDLYDVQESNIKLPIWAVTLIILLGLVPIANVILFLIGLVVYWYHLTPEKYADEYYMFSLRGDNLITKFLLFIKKILSITI